MALSFLKEPKFLSQGYADTTKATMSKQQKQQQHQNLQAILAPFNNNDSAHNNNNNTNNNNSGSGSSNSSNLSSLMNMAFMHPLSFAVLQAQMQQNPMTAVAAASLVPSIYNPNFIPTWPQSASTPPTILPTEPISPVNNNNNSNVNKNLINSGGNNRLRMSQHQNTTSMDRLVARKKTNPEMKKRAVNKTNDGVAEIASNASTTSSSTSSPDAVKDTAIRDKVFTCNICNRSFGYKHVLQNHERTHTGEKPFECKECHKKFTRDHHLKTHMRLHTGEKPYSCTHCERQFVQVANLRRHLRVHTGERPYTCEICNGKFSDSNQLKAHLLVHQDEKPFECKHCFQRFRRRHHFIQHKCSPVNNIIGNNNNNSPPVRIIPEHAANEESNGSLRSENEGEMPVHAHQQSIQRRQDESSGVLPLNLSYSVKAPVQTEPEDLSMSSRMRSEAGRPDSRAFSGSVGRSTPMSQSNSETEDEVEEEDKKQAEQERVKLEEMEFMDCSSYGIASDR